MYKFMFMYIYKTQTDAHTAHAPSDKKKNKIYQLHGRLATNLEIDTEGATSRIGVLASFLEIVTMNPSFCICNPNIIVFLMVRQFFFLKKNLSIFQWHGCMATNLEFETEGDTSRTGIHAFFGIFFNT